MKNISIFYKRNIGVLQKHKITKDKEFISLKMGGFRDAGERLTGLELGQRDLGNSPSAPCSFCAHSPVYPLPGSKLGEKLGTGQAQDVIL